VSVSVRPLLQRLCIIGVGLIGGSLAKALKRAGAVGEVIGAGRREESLRKALELGVIDCYETELATAVRSADVVVVAVPLGAMWAVFAAIAEHLPKGCVLTDVGSAKGSVVEDVQRVFGHTPSTFVPGHPIAGTEKSGVESAFAELFQGRKVILTPLRETSASAHALVRRMWEVAGAEVVEMEVRHHDEVLAATSHLPHVLAYCLVDTLAGLDNRAEMFRFAAGGFRDFTRIASSDPQMWHDICLANRGPLLKAMEQFNRELSGLAKAIANGDSDAIMLVFQRAKRARDNLYLD
jgi:prephenate dehydrogenase